jgi:hypothetical protein
VRCRQSKAVPVNRPWWLKRLWDVEVSTFCRQSAHRWWGQPYAPVAFYPQEDSLYSFLLRGWVDPRAISAAGRIWSREKCNDIGNRTGDLPACSIVSQCCVDRVPPESDVTEASERLYLIFDSLSSRGCVGQQAHKHFILIPPPIHFNAYCCLVAAMAFIELCRLRLALCLTAKSHSSRRDWEPRKVKLPLCLIKQCAMKAYGGVEV